MLNLPTSSPVYLFTIKEGGEKKTLEHFEHVIKIFPNREDIFKNILNILWNTRPAIVKASAASQLDQR